MYRHPQAADLRHHVKRHEEAEKQGLQSAFANQRVRRHVRTHLNVLCVITGLQEPGTPRSRARYPH